MISSSKNKPVDLLLVDEVCKRIPPVTWHYVTEVLIADLVNAMPSHMLYKLTGSYEDFDKAENLLTNYYSSKDKQKDLIIDTFSILGDETVLYRLEGLQLDKYAEHLISQDNAPCSIQPE